MSRARPLLCPHPVKFCLGKYSSLSDKLCGDGMSALETGRSEFGFSLKCLEPEGGAFGCGHVPSGGEWPRWPLTWGDGAAQWVRGKGALVCDSLAEPPWASWHSLQ